jgi:hypothetical protein
MVELIRYGHRPQHVPELAAAWVYLRRLDRQAQPDVDGAVGLYRVGQPGSIPLGITSISVIRTWCSRSTTSLPAPNAASCWLPLHRGGQPLRRFLRDIGCTGSAVDPE